MLMSSNCAREHLTAPLSCLTVRFSSSVWTASPFENDLKVNIILGNV
jgi:hypothetical protein